MDVYTASSPKLRLLQQPQQQCHRPKEPVELLKDLEEFEGAPPKGAPPKGAPPTTLLAGAPIHQPSARAWPSSFAEAFVDRDDATPDDPKVGRTVPGPAPRIDTIDGGLEPRERGSSERGGGSPPPPRATLATNSGGGLRSPPGGGADSASAVEAGDDGTRRFREGYRSWAHDAPATPSYDGDSSSRRIALRDHAEERWVFASEVAIYLLSGLILIFMMEQLVKIGELIAMRKI